ncbi:hypothetical protein ACQCN2_06855 [Brevibacillus ginsengisoli]|uniref:hypothetical protein n=1 Tax=Brevibacillus ginsengisoli TaxID=363854 RepID=UPI003CF6786B
MFQISLFVIGLGIASAYALNSMWVHTFNTIIADIFYISFTLMMTKLSDMENMEDDESTIE